MERSHKIRDPSASHQHRTAGDCSKTSDYTPTASYPTFQSQPQLCLGPLPPMDGSHGFLRNRGALYLRFRAMVQRWVQVKQTGSHSEPV